jgi:hypothetical protein
MNAASDERRSGEWSARAPRFYQGPADSRDGVELNYRYYTHPVGEELAAGLVASITFGIDRPAKEVWRHLKDFNAWQNPCDHYYSGVIGDLEGKTYRLSAQRNDDGPHQYRVTKVIPEHLIVTEQPGPWNGGSKPYDGYSVFMINEHAGKSLVAITMQHAIRTRGKAEEEALSYWRQMEPALVGKWRDSFAPNLKKLVNQGKL